MSWYPLPAGPWGVSATLPDIDPCLVWADGTGAADFVRAGAPVPQLLPFIIELRDRCTVATLQAELGAQGGQVPALYPAQARFCTAELSDTFVRAWAQGGYTTSAIARMELQWPVLPQRAPAQATGLATPALGAVKSTHPVLLGVVDSGCPFAHRALRSASGGTRLLALWDQGQGLAWLRTELDALMSAARGTGGTLNEPACYQAAGMHGLRRRLAHGAGVLDLLAGPLNYGRRTSSTPDTSAPGYAGGPTGDPASAMDLVFVDLPASVVQDSSSAGLPRHLLDGLRYILGCAGPQTRHVVVNISDGTSRGSHDGQSLIERAMDDLVATAPAGEGEGPKLHLVLPAGNAYQEQRHAQFGAWVAGEVQRVSLLLPPGSEAAAWCWVQVPNALAPHLQVRLLPPAGAPAGPWVGAGDARAFGPSAGATTAGVVYPAVSQVGTTTPVLLAWRPTTLATGQQPAAPAGRWTLELRCAQDAPNETVHAYICRNQTNLGALARAQQARFVDQAYDPQRHLRPAYDDPAAPLSPIRREGSLNGLATGATVNVAGGVRLRDELPSLYSASGTTQAAPRASPDASVASDESSALDGLHVAGTLSGAVVRLHGTSFAAPQLARKLANGLLRVKGRPGRPSRRPRRTGPLLLDP